MNLPRISISLLIACMAAMPVCAEEAKQDEVNLDIVTGTINQTAAKVNAFLTGNLDFQVSVRKPSDPNDYERDAIGRKVPKSTAVKSGQSLHSDQPL